jgi:putative ABC transport system permease protein
MTVGQDMQRNKENLSPMHKKVSGNSRSSVSTIRRRVKKKHRNLKQIFVLSLDSLRERKLRSALTILMVVVGGALMVAINGISAGSGVFMVKQIGSLAPNVIFVSPGSKSNIFQLAPGLATMAPRLPFNDEVVSRIKLLPFVKDVVPVHQAQVQLNIEGYKVNSNVNAMKAGTIFMIAPSLTLIPGSKIESNNPSAMLVGYDIANPPGYTHNPLIRLGQTVKATYSYSSYGSTSWSFVVTGILKETGNGNADRIVVINTNTGNIFFHKLGRYDVMVVLADSGSDVSTVVQELSRLAGGENLGIVTPAAIVQAQQGTQSGSTSLALVVGFIALLAGGIGVVTTLWTSVSERTNEVGTMKAIGAKPWFILSMFLSDAVLIGLIGSTVGIFTGIGLAYVLSASGASLGGHPGTAASHIPPIFLPDDLLRVWLLSLIISLAAGVFPAWKASRLSPLEALHVE